MANNFVRNKEKNGLSSYIGMSLNDATQTWYEDTNVAYIYCFDDICLNFQEIDNDDYFDYEDDYFLQEDGDYDYDSWEDDDYDYDSWEDDNYDYESWEDDDYYYWDNYDFLYNDYDSCENDDDTEYIPSTSRRVKHQSTKYIRQNMLRQELKLLTIA